jgi:hypothetical protein
MAHALSRREFLIASAAAAAGALMACCAPAAPSTVPAVEAVRVPTVVVRPQEYTGALRNPLKGFRANYPHAFGTLEHSYIRWNDLEDQASDGPDEIRAFCDTLWRDFPAHNVKAIPRVWLYMPPQHAKITHSWPSDLQDDDYSSPQFKERVVKLVEKLGVCWDTDPRVAYVEMGIIGWWGEHHDPDVSPEMQTTLGDAFTAAFARKPIMVRHARDFQDYHFGIHWDSWAHQDQMNWDKGGAPGIAALGDRWKTAVIGGETAYDWGNYQIQPGDSPNDTVTDPAHYQFLVDTIRWLHCNHLGWVSDYAYRNPATQEGAGLIQRALGYRFVLDEIRYPARLAPGEPFEVSFTVRNTGSSPMYGDWPVEASLLYLETGEIAWQDTFSGLDIRTWLPGDRWDKARQAYEDAPLSYETRGTFVLPAGVPEGEYALALAILDPAGMLPSARFAIENYITGGRHPIGMVGIGTTPERAEVAPEQFDDPQEDWTLRYAVQG